MDDGSILFDSRGRPIPNGEIRLRAAEQLQNYMVKNKSRFDDWFRANGPRRPPIFYNVEKKEWIWAEA